MLNSETKTHIFKIRRSTLYYL